MKPSLRAAKGARAVRPGSKGIVAKLKKLEKRVIDLEEDQRRLEVEQRRLRDVNRRNLRGWASLLTLAAKMATLFGGRF